MRTTTTRFRALKALAVSGALVVLAGGLAQADDISNTIDGTVDSVAEVMPLNVGGAVGTTALYVSPVNGDGKNGCNLTGMTSLTLAVATSDPAVATVSPATVTFTSCGDTKLLTVTPVAIGSATITAAVTNNTTAGTFDLAAVTFSVLVAGPANTAPQVSVGGVVEGASYDKGTVPVATCEVTDAEDGDSSFPATLSAMTGPYASDGLGAQTASCAYTDDGGLTASGSETYSIVDPSAPVVSHVLSPAAPDGLNGWYIGDVSLGWAVDEPESPNSLITTGCVDQLITEDQLATTYWCSAISAGGATTGQVVTIKRDSTAPHVEYTSATGTTGANDWYTSAVTATFTGTDATSGPAVATKTATSVGEGSAVAVDSPAFSDDAGNITAIGAASPIFRVDLSDPIATFDGTIQPSYFGSVPQAPTCTASDAVSGPAGCVVTGYSTTVGTHTLTATATDLAGRTATATQQYIVLPWTTKGFYQPVNMDGVFNTVKSGSTVPVKFELFAGETELTNTDFVALSAKKITCSTSALLDEVEVLASGNTSLRYDSTGGQYVYNWKTPTTGAGTCYTLTMTADDGSTLSANFKLK